MLALYCLPFVRYTVSKLTAWHPAAPLFRVNPAHAILEKSTSKVVFCQGFVGMVADLALGDIVVLRHRFLPALKRQEC